MNETNTRPDAGADDARQTLVELGKELKALRESRGMTLDALAAETCIRKNFLEDIEAGDFSRFKALVYARGFVRGCAELLESPELWDKYSRVLTAEHVEPAAASQGAVYPTGPGRVSPLPSNTSHAAAPARGFRQSSTRRNCLIALFALAAAAIVGLACNWDRIRGEIARIQAEQAESAVKKREAEQALLAEKKRAEEEAVTREREERAKTASEPETPETPPKPAEPEKAPEPAAPAKPALTIRATGECWIRVRDGRKTLFENTVNGGWEMTFDLESPLDVVFGLGQHVSVSANGADFAPLGRGRQHLEYLPDGTSERLPRPKS